jgi:vacuolar protein sorting-associated protein 35
MINVSQSTQENNLIKLSKEVETKTNHIKEYLNTKNFSKCLSDISELILLLKIDTLSPSNYFILYSELYDILQETIEYYIREKTLNGVKIKYIYDTVQQSQYLLPRLYLMIIAGGIYLEIYPNNYREIL